MPDERALLEVTSAPVRQQEFGATRASIVICAFNAAAFIEKAVASALRQTERRIEVVICDDASTDGTAAIVRRMMSRDRRILLVANDRNLGPSASRNRAIERASGTWIAVLDADDEFAAERIEELIGAAEKHRCDVAADNLEVYDGQTGKTVGPAFKTWFDDVAIVSVEHYVERNLFLKRTFKLGYLKPIVRRSLLDRYNVRYDEKIWVGEDYHFLLDCLFVCGKMCLLGKPMYRYRQTSNSLSRKFKPSHLQTLLRKGEGDLLHVLAQTSGPTAVSKALAARQRSIEDNLRLIEIVDDMKRFAAFDAARHLIARRAIIGPLLWACVEALAKRSPWGIGRGGLVKRG